MKVLRPAVTCVLTSHMKPAYLHDALWSAVSQTRRDIEVIVADSGQWITQAYTEDKPVMEMVRLHSIWASHPLVQWVTTGELPGLRHSKCPVAWTANEVIRAGLVRGRYMCTFYDDDVYRPRFMEAMAGFLDDHPGHDAVWCSQQMTAIDRDGSTRDCGIRHADGVRLPGQLDCMVDGGQVMWRTAMLSLIGDPWLPEEPDDSCRHSDGIFLERLARVTRTGSHPVGEVLCENRKTPLSAYTPT